MNQHMIIPRVSDDETTFAVIEFAGVPRDRLKAAIQTAVQDWIDNSDEGQSALENSSEDFNIGDLANELPDVNLMEIGADVLAIALRKQGLTYLSIDIHSSSDTNCGWEFDDVLYPAE